MITQEILVSLSQLEQELQSIKSARVLAEETIQAYSDVKKDISTLLSEFGSVTNSLNSLAHSFENENQTLSDEIQNSIKIVKGQLETLNTAFANQCNSVIIKFMESINSTTDSLKNKTESLSTTYESHNNTFKGRIDELTSVHNSLIKATESVVSIKADIAELQKELNESQKGQDKTIEKIALDLEKNGINHTQILTQITNDLKTSQDSQDEDLANIKDAVSSNVSKLDTVISKIDGVANSILGNTSSIETKISKVASLCNTNKILIIVNILIAIATLVIALIK